MSIVCNEYKSSPVIIVVGPTGVGKSDFAKMLAETVDGIIINGDMGQMYEPLTIGTAKPNWHCESVPHILFDSIKEPRNSSALEFRYKVEEAVQGVLQSGRIPIIVGGSMFYISNLFFKPSEVIIDQNNNDVKTNHNDNIENKSLWQALFDIDRDRALKLHPHDTYRIQRALAINTVKKASLCYPTFNPIHDNCILIHIERLKDELYARINERVMSMIEQGWLDEIRELDLAWKSWLLKKKIIGYDILIQALSRSSFPWASDIDLVQQKTRNYAKRQMTFFRSFSSKLRLESFHNIVECNLTLSSVDLYLEKVLSFMAYKP